MLKPRLQKHYEKIVCEDFILLYNFANISQLPRFERALFHSTSNFFASDKLSLLQSVSSYFLVTSQRPTTSKARKSIALFSIRKGNVLGIEVTLRKTALFHFLDKLLIFVLPKSVSLLKNNTESASKSKLPQFSGSNELPGLCKNFVMSSRNSGNFLEVSQLLLFFNSLVGFSFDCSLFLFSRTRPIVTPFSASSINVNCKTSTVVKNTEISSQSKALCSQNKALCSQNYKKSQKVIAFKNIRFQNFVEAFTLKNVLSENRLILTSTKKKIFLSAFQYPIYKT